MPATLTKPSSSSINQTSVTVNYAVSGYSLPGGATTPWTGTAPTSGSTWRQTRKVTTYTRLAYSWSFGSTRQSGSHTFTNLSPGGSRQISATVTISCTKSEVTQTQTNTRQWIPGADGAPGKWGNWQGWSQPTSSAPSTSNHIIANNVSTNTIIVYTKPSEFYWGNGVAKDSIIQISGGLEASKWNELVTKTEQYANWKNQSGGASYSNAKASSGEIITANKYNILANALGISSVRQETTNSTGDLITAAVFIALQTAVNR